MQKSKLSSQDDLVDLDQRSLEAELAHEISSLVAKSVKKGAVPCENGIENVKYLGKEKCIERTEDLLH